MVLNHDILPLRFVNNKAGIYIISYLDSPESRGNKKVLIKVGRSYDLKKRLDNYHTCFPDSFFTWSLILTSKRNYIKLEKEIHNALKRYLYKHEEYDARRTGEWFFITKDRLKNIINGVLKKNNKVGGIGTYIFNVHPDHFILRKD